MESKVKDILSSSITQKKCNSISLKIETHPSSKEHRAEHSIAQLLVPSNDVINDCVNHYGSVHCIACTNTLYTIFRGSNRT